MKMTVNEWKWLTDEFLNSIINYKETPSPKVEWVTSSDQIGDLEIQLRKGCKC